MLLRTLVVLAIAALALAFLVAFVVFLKLLSGALLIAVAAIFLAYAINPIVRVLQRRLPILAAVSVTYLLLLSIIVMIFVISLPPLTLQAQQFFSAIPAIAESARQSIIESGIIGRLPQSVQNDIDAVPAQIARLLETYGGMIAQQSLNAVFSVAAVSLSLIVVPILAAYLIFDANELKRGAIGFVPPPHRPKALALIADINDILGGFIRGQIIDGLIIGTLIWLMLSINHVPYALLIGVVSAFLNFVPYLSIVSIIPSLLLALAYNGWQNALIVGSLFAIIQQIDGNFIEPFVVRVNIALSPTLVIGAIAGFTALFGPFGAFVAVPTVAILRIVKLHFSPAPSATDLLADSNRSTDLRRFRFK